MAGSPAHPPHRAVRSSLFLLPSRHPGVFLVGGCSAQRRSSAPLEIRRASCCEAVRCGCGLVEPREPKANRRPERLGGSETLSLRGRASIPASSCAGQAWAKAEAKGRVGTQGVHHGTRPEPITLGSGQGYASEAEGGQRGCLFAAIRDNPDCPPPALS